MPAELDEKEGKLIAQSMQVLANFVGDQYPLEIDNVHQIQMIAAQLIPRTEDRLEQLVTG